MTTDASRFYYLRLMAKRDGGMETPVAVSRPKFVQWGTVRRFSTSIEETPELESQAMRIVRTIGQAFEVCHKINTEQEQEAVQLDAVATTSRGGVAFEEKASDTGSSLEQVDDDEETTTIGKVRIKNKASLAVIESAAQLKRQAADDRKYSIKGGDSSPCHSRSSSPAISSRRSSERVSAPPERLITQKSRLEPVPGSPRRKSADLSVSSSLGSGTMHAAGIGGNQQQQVANPLASIPQLATSTNIAGRIEDTTTTTNQPAPQSQHPFAQQPPLWSASGLQQMGQQSSLSGAQQHSQHLLPQSQTWTGAIHHPPSGYSTLSSLGVSDPYGSYTAMMGSISAADAASRLPYSVSSPQVSPYPTLALSQLLAASAALGNTAAAGQMNVPGALSPLRAFSPLSPTGTLSPMAQAGAEGGHAISKALEHYSLNLIRSQLEQAQQQAQVALAQVQLLRDQLAAETTARLEAQGRTHQLLVANRELIDQVQLLVGRLQSLEIRITGTSAGDPMQLASASSSAAPPSTFQPDPSLLDQHQSTQQLLTQLQQQQRALDDALTAVKTQAETMGAKVSLPAVTTLQSQLQQFPQALLQQVQVAAAAAQKPPLPPSYETKPPAATSTSADRKSGEWKRSTSVAVTSTEGLLRPPPQSKVSAPATIMETRSPTTEQSAGGATTSATTSDATSDYSSSEQDITMRYAAAVQALAQQYAQQKEYAGVLSGITGGPQRGDRQQQQSLDEILAREYAAQMHVQQQREEETAEKNKQPIDKKLEKRGSKGKILDEKSSTSGGGGEQISIGGVFGRDRRPSVWNRYNLTRDTKSLAVIGGLSTKDNKERRDSGGAGGQNESANEEEENASPPTSTSAKQSRSSSVVTVKENTRTPRPSEASMLGRLSPPWPIPRLADRSATEHRSPPPLPPLSALFQQLSSDSCSTSASELAVLENHLGDAPAAAQNSLTLFNDLTASPQLAPKRAAKPSPSPRKATQDRSPRDILLDKQLSDPALLARLTRDVGEYKLVNSMTDARSKNSIDSAKHNGHR